MNKALYNVVYNRKKKLLSNGTALVQIVAYLRGNRKFFSTKIYITPNQWDSRHCRIKNHLNAVRLNNHISEFISMLNNVELERINTNKTFTLNHLTDFLDGKLTDSFTEFMCVEVEQSQLGHATKVCERTTLRAFKEFKLNVLFTELDYELLTSFERFLYSKGLSINTVHKYFRHIRKFVNLAINKDLMELNKYPFRNFKLKSEDTTREHLTPEELERIEKIKLPKDKQHLRKIIDMYLFSCYTGLRFSDITELKKSNIIVEDGKQWLTLKMQKTKENIRLPLFALSKIFKGKLLEILNLYTPSDNRQLIFDDLTNQYVNRCLKEIATITEITKLITFHTARHTVATHLLYKGLSITTVQKLLGHKKIQTTQIYSKVMDMTIVNDLENIAL